MIPTLEQIDNEWVVHGLAWLYDMRAEIDRLKDLVDLHSGVAASSIVQCADLQTKVDRLEAELPTGWHEPKQGELLIAIRGPGNTLGGVLHTAEDAKMLAEIMLARHGKNPRLREDR